MPQQAVKRIRRSTEDARAEILRAAEAALAAKDFTALTVDDVMTGTGMTRSSFYHYFSGLDALALGLLEQFEHEIRASVAPWLEDAEEGDPVEATVTHLTEMFEVMEARRASVYAVAQAAGGYPTVYEQWQRRVVDYFVDLTASFIRRQVELGRSRADDPERLARALVLMNNGVANDRMRRDDRTDPRTVAEVVAGVWNAAIFGLAPGA
jgi:AcrR family transcriptional regulator